MPLFVTSNHVSEVSPYFTKNTRLIIVYQLTNIILHLNKVCWITILRIILSILIFKFSSCKNNDNNYYNKFTKKIHDLGEKLVFYIINNCYIGYFNIIIAIYTIIRRIYFFRKLQIIESNKENNISPIFFKRVSTYGIRSW